MMKHYDKERIVFTVILWCLIIFSFILCFAFCFVYSGNSSEYKNGYIAGKIDAYKEINDYIKKNVKE